MKLTIKTLDQKTVQFDFAEDKTVWDLKTHLHNIPEISLQPDRQQIIYAGRILANADRLSTYCIDERKFLVVMSSKLQATEEEQKKPAEKSQSKHKSDKEAKGQKPEHTAASPPAPAQAQTQASVPSPAAAPAPAPAPAPALYSPIPEPPAIPLPLSTPNTDGGAVAIAGPIAGAVLQNVETPPTTNIDEQLVQNITNMGYPEAEVRRALAASFNNPDRAISYLIEGIPDTLDEDDTDLFSGAGAGAAAAVAEANAPSDNGNALAFLRNDPHFEQMREIIHQSPDLLPAILARIGESNPSMLSLIRQHQAEFIEMLNEPIVTPPGDEAPEGASVIEIPALTQEDRNAIERLVELGFPHEVVVQVYIACEKNEEHAADMLFRHYAD